MRRTNSDFMTGVPELLILKLLIGRDMYGYEIAREIESANGEGLSISEAILYPTLHSLEKRGCLKAKRKTVNGRTRVYYSATKSGRARLNTMMTEWQRITSIVSAMLGRRADASI